MFVGRITVPLAVPHAFGIGLGDDVAWEIEDDRVVLTKVAPPSPPFVADLSAFIEWAANLDAVHDVL